MGSPSADLAGGGKFLYRVARSRLDSEKSRIRLSVGRIGLSAEALKFCPLVFCLALLAGLGKGAGESKVCVGAAGGELHSDTELGHGLIRMSEGEPEATADDVGGKIAGVEGNGFTGKFQALLIVGDAEEFKGQLDSGGRTGGRNLDFAAKLADGGGWILLEKKDAVHIVNAGLGRIEGIKLFQLFAGGDPILHGNEGLGMAGAADKGIASLGDFGREGSRDAEGCEPEGVDEGGVGEDGVFGGLGVSGCDAIGDEGEALECELGLAEVRVQNAVVVEDGPGELAVGAEAEIPAAFQRIEGALVLMEMKLAEAEHAESGTGLAVFDDNEVFEGGAGFGVLSSVEEDGSQIPPAFGPGGLERGGAFEEAGGLRGSAAVHGRLGALSQLIEGLGWRSTLG